MASLKDNYNVFAIDYQWPERGDEWSQPWGNTHYLWLITILPRIRSFLPTKNILEIAPGYGRCTQYLKDVCHKLIVVDISEKCIQACQDRFCDSKNIVYHLNDGKSLDMISDHSIDFIFSWDSLVHADVSVMEAYIRQFPRILTPNGYGFIHHSNLAEYAGTGDSAIETGQVHFRDETMDASLFSKFSRESGLRCIVQEKINWRCELLIDCISLFTSDNRAQETPPQMIENYNFMEEAKIARYLSSHYNLTTGIESTNLFKSLLHHMKRLRDT